MAAENDIGLNTAGWDRFVDAIAEMLADIRMAEIQSELNGDANHDKVHKPRTSLLPDRQT